MGIPFEDGLIGAPSTVRVQKILFGKWIRPELEAGIEISDRNLPFLVQKWLKAGLAPGSVGALVSLCSKFARWTGGSIDTSRVAKMLRRQEQPRPKAIAREEATRLLRYAARTEYAAAVVLGLNFGMRIGEIYGLDWNNVLFDSRQIRVEKSRDVLTGEMGPVKTLNSRRLIPGGEEAFALLAEKRGVGPVAPYVKGVYRWFPVLCDEAEVGRITPHAMRHTYCSLLLEAGVSLKQVADLAGDTVQTIVSTYWWCLKTDADLSALPTLEA